MRVAKQNNQGTQNTQSTTGTPNSQVLAVAASQADTSASRTETWLGKEYLVVPVVAIVEGVLFGANASAPELAAAAEFGKFPESWNGRPLVMNHPQVAGLYVSAGSPKVLEDNAFGFMFNTYLDGTKLKTEAWIDVARVAELGGTTLATLERIQNGDTVEVSVGAFIEVVPSIGTYNGKAYSGAWSSVAPDHLAFLEEGVEGACSVKDGCGVPRLNQASNTPNISRADFVVYKASCCTACATGQTCDGKEESMPGQATNDGEPLELELTDAQQLNAVLLERRTATIQQLAVEAVDPSLDLYNAREAVFMALQTHLNAAAYDLEIVALTTEQVAYYLWDYKPRYSYFALAYNVDDSGNVTFTGDPSPVNVVTRIVPRNEVLSSGEVNANGRNEDMPGNNSQEDNGSSAAAGAGGGAPVNAGAASGATTELAAPVQVKSFSELLAEAPADVRAQFDYGMQAYTARKNELIKSLTALENNPYSAEDMQAMDVPALEKLTALANVPVYSGRAFTGADHSTVSGEEAKPAFAAASRNFLAAKE